MLLNIAALCVGLWATNGIVQATKDTHSTVAYHTLPGRSRFGEAEAPIPIVFRDVNILAVTDVHSWISGGDRLENSSTPLDATFGDLTSLVERARAAAAILQKDVFLVDNGDIVDGTGLSNAAPDKCSYLLGLYSQVPFDALNCGNHELYQSSTMETFASSRFISDWDGKYLTSNLINTETRFPLGSPYRFIVGPVSGIKLLTFGFMYNMTKEEGLCDAVTVIPVQEVLASAQFIGTLETVGRAADAVLVLAHMDADEPLIVLIVQAVRKVLPDTPVQVIAGHSHMRKATKIDGRALAFEPGNYFNTVGYTSFDIPKGNAADVDFNYFDFDSSKASLSYAVNMTPSTFSTIGGRATSELIAMTEEALGLSDVIGCSNETYGDDDLWNLVMTRIIPETLFVPPHNPKQWFVEATGADREPIYAGNVTGDDIFKTFPFGNPYFAVSDVQGSVLQSALKYLNADPGLFQYDTTDPNPDPSTMYQAMFVSFDEESVLNAMSNVSGGNQYIAEPYRPLTNDTDILRQWVKTALKCH